ncbi:translocation/assembly module TamB domain-containing protein [Desulfotalea psychrophila]|uniref:Translocation and assembly module TamB C-terminal domain-containing protein n=1 Tax=Desulfotalea psychrophila (strain LSv54 / DSM 12343) TaxID=177439 RepID=Q6ANA0_DESPS|nr:translocation/assembly module TamB domain-containing protein [Desulfotalea psychrophila]CAG36174.1 conserved hypothetical protein [Desulfotalea psychrophila LSv54]
MMKKILLTLLTLFFCLQASLAVLFYSEVGTRLVQQLLEKYPNEAISITSIEGRLGSDLTIRDLLVKTPLLDISADVLHLALNPAGVILGHLSVSELKIKELKFFFKVGDDPEPEVVSDEPFILSLPEQLVPFVGIYLKNLQIDGIGFYAPDGERVEYLDRALLSADVDGKRVTIRNLQVEDEAYAVKLSGSARTGKVWLADISGDWRFSNWDGGELLGTLAAKGPLPDMDVKVVLLAPTRVDIVGKMTKLPGNPYFEVTGKGVKTALPLIHPSCPDIRLDAQVKAWGNINDYYGVLKSKGEYWKFKGISGELALHGNFDNIHFKDVLFKHEKTVVGIEGCYLDWENAFMVGGLLNIRGFNPGVIDERFSGSLDGVIDGKLTYDDALSAWYNLQNVRGTLRGYPLTAGVKLRFTGDSLDLDKVFLSSGSSYLDYQGHFKEKMDMSLRLRSLTLATLLPFASGLVDADLSLAGDYATPLLRGTFSGKDLRFWDYYIGAMDGRVVDASAQGRALQLKVEARELHGYGVDAEIGSVNMVGTPEKHKGTLTLGQGADSLKIRFAGGLKDAAWQLGFSRFSLSHRYLGNWHLAGKPSFLLSSQEIALQGLDLVSQGAKFHLEGGADFSGEENPYSFSAGLKDYPLSLLNDKDIVDPLLSGKVSGELSLAGDGEKITSARVAGHLGDFRFALPSLSGKEKQYSKVGADLSADFDGKALVAKFAARINEGLVQLDLGADWNGNLQANLGSIGLSGKGTIRALSLEPLGILTGYLLESEGDIEGDLALSGTLGKPILHSKLDLVSGNILLPSQGVELKDVTLLIENLEDRGLTLEANLSSGAGRAQATGTLLWQNDFDLAGEIQIKGKDVLVLDMPEYLVVLSPDIDLKFDGKRMDISGKIAIPKARIMPNNLSSAVSQSDDVVFLDLKTGAVDRAYKLQTGLEIEFGEDVRFEQSGLVGKLAGTIFIRDESSKPMTATGKLNLVDGKFAAYGRTLDIVRGQILFTGGSVTNPGVDVRAQKEVFLQKGIRGRYILGIDITGSASDLRYTLFSSPYMAQADILSYLLMGQSLFSISDSEGNILADAATKFGWSDGANLIRSIASALPIDTVHMETDFEDSDVSLVLGKNLTDTLYLGYDYNILDQVGEVHLRYDLENGFFIDTKGSSEATGADILYIFER